MHNRRSLPTLFACLLCLHSLSLSLSLCACTVLCGYPDISFCSRIQKKFWRFEDLQGQKIVSETNKGRKEERVKALQGQTLQCERERERERKKREFCFLCFTLLLLLAISLPLLLKVFYVLLQKEDVIMSRSTAGLLLYLLRVFLLS